MAEKGKKSRGKIMKRKVSDLCVLMLALFQLNASATAQSNTSTSPLNPAELSYKTLPANITVAVGEPAVFRCGVSPASKVTFTLHGSHGNHSLTCPGEPVNDIPQALYGSCQVKREELQAVWTMRGTSYSDDSTRVECQQQNHPDAPAAFLHVYDNGASLAIIIGCAIGGFFGALLVFGLSYTMLQRSETLQRCFRGDESENDDITIITKDEN
ncbi:uncharacterized protein LOC115373301 [Myripristis murdjan]|uniref:uncharacterized protein LOC115373301 n=1 Tax=Myripristis murdjan TaxID=586833 RepID=UPI0011764474|nr:uncharacterized protein LOC115373301 [Myripristis murdjan]XP_029927479.1 uncharacterized protein LOC115373301 [Myripristis murdjan]